jgi:hypothetical protein
MDRAGARCFVGGQVLSAGRAAGDRSVLENLTWSAGFEGARAQSANFSKASLLPVSC